MKKINIFISLMEEKNIRELRALAKSFNVKNINNFRKPDIINQIKQKQSVIKILTSNIKPKSNIWEEF